MFMGMDIHIWAEIKFAGEEVASFDKSKKVVKVRKDLYSSETLFDASGRVCWPLWDWCKNNLDIVKAVDVDDTDDWELSYEDVKKLCESAKAAYKAMAEKVVTDKWVPYGKDGWELVYDHWQEFDVEEGSKYFTFYRDDCSEEELNEMREMYIWVVYTIADKCNPWMWHDEVKCGVSDCKYYMMMSH